MDSSTQPTNTISEEAPTEPIQLQIHTGSHVINTPFFLCDTSAKLTATQSAPAGPEQDTSTVSVIDSIKSIDKKTSGFALRKLYRDIKDNDYGFSVNPWMFLSVNEVSERQDVYAGKMIDIAIKYCGMGHVLVIAYVPATDKFVVRRDGGSNGYEREAYYTEYSSNEYTPALFQVYSPPSVSQSDNTAHTVESSSGFFFGSLFPKTQYSYSDLMPLISPNWIL
ncbi:hypothetical protein YASMINEVIRUS_166 [Yasminevirus sp. GU-2018]|uniref:Uncharacterized protein n=1 Tax=Yasminevirus sp. GU-2018 TaxID=2420051 RepID=A0A5K0U8N7_9VIRU|nr:hypothetical protein YASMINEVIRUS_166 [Yasminevirus sp. GU-2018]